ncbi:MAG: Gfo/Idh/MocA family oxidoreductase [Verrucomicrobiae bacterium]|nr:Gfo/Idh/MocA family oxidoreductase [Verrucomicrobiae bacterium]
MTQTSSSPVRVGLAGLGRSGWFNHAVTLHALGGKYQLAAVTDPNPNRCREAAGKFGARIHGDFDALLGDPDVELVVVATPNRLHCEQALLALARGRHVVVEKPMAGDESQADQMIEASQREKRILTVFQNQRYMPAFKKVEEVIASGKLGRIAQIRICVHSFGRRWDWQTLKEFNGGELNNTGPHFLDQALMLFGAAEPEVFCHLDRTLTSGDAEDHVKVILRAPGAPLVEVEISKAAAYPQNLWTVWGTQGGLTGTARELSWKYVDFSKMPARPVERQPTTDRSYNSETYTWQEEKWQEPKDSPSTQTLFYEDLYKTLRQGAPLVIQPGQIRRQMALIHQCHKICAD